jgi:hypothetical protein
MPIDFNSLVGIPNMLVFAIPVTHTPKGGVSYLTQGIWSMTHLDVMMDDGSKLSTVTISLGISLSQFYFIPAVGDTIALAESGQTFLIDDIQPDGQGGAKLLLKAAVPVLAGPV